MTQASLANRVYETTTSTGAGAVTLAGAATPRHRTFLGALGAAATTFYCIAHRAAAEWEVGVGLVNGDGTLTRTTVIKNHLGTTATVNFSAGTKDVFQDVPAEKLLTLDADSSALTVPGAIKLNGLSYTFPASQAANRYLKTDGAGNLTWASILETLGLTDLSDVLLTAPGAGEMLRYNGAAWVNSTDGSALTALNASSLASGTAAVTRGGTGLGLYAVGDLLYASATTALSKLAAAANNTVLSLVGGLPAWVTALVLAGSVTAASFSGPLTGNVTGNVSGNAGTATALQTARAINGVNFDGTAPITVTAAAGTLTGTTLNATVTGSSLTSHGTLVSGAVPASLVTAGTFGTGAYTFPGLVSMNGALTVNASGSLFNAGADASTTTTIGNGGGAPTTYRNAFLSLNAPSSVSFPGSAQLRLYRNSGSQIWDAGLDATIAGMKTADTDFAWRYNATTFVASLTTAGQLRTAAGVYTMSTIQVGGTFTASSGILISQTQTASGGVARGLYVTPILTAAANADTLAFAVIGGTFSAGALTGVIARGISITAMSTAAFTSPANPIALEIGALTGTGATAAYGLSIASVTGAATNYAIATGLGLVLFGDHVDLAAGKVYRVNGTQVVAARDTGWTAMTGSPDKATAYATGTVTLAQLAGRVAQLQASLTTHGLIGA